MKAQTAPAMNAQRAPAAMKAQARCFDALAAMDKRLSKAGTPLELQSPRDDGSCPAALVRHLFSFANLNPHLATLRDPDVVLGDAVEPGLNVQWLRENDWRWFREHFGRRLRAQTDAQYPFFVSPLRRTWETAVVFFFAVVGSSESGVPHVTLTVEPRLREGVPDWTPGTAIKALGMQLDLSNHRSKTFETAACKFVQWLLRADASSGLPSSAFTVALRFLDRSPGGSPGASPGDRVLFRIDRGRRRADVSFFASSPDEATWRTLTADGAWHDHRGFFAAFDERYAREGACRRLDAYPRDSFFFGHGTCFDRTLSTARDRAYVGNGGVLQVDEGGRVVGKRRGVPKLRADVAGCDFAPCDDACRARYHRRHAEIRSGRRPASDLARH